MSEPLAWIDDESRTWSRRGLSRRLDVLGASTPRAVERDRAALVNFASNDYLGLASDPRVIAAGIEAAERYGWGAGASPLVCGWREPHEHLAEELAAFEQAEAAVLFPTGYAANLGTLAALAGRGDVIYSDRLNHACLIDGARLSRAQVRVYEHNDVVQLAALMAGDRGRFRRALIATDGVFSMDGDLAGLADLADLADRAGAMLLVDEAHATGVYGPDGRGAASECGVADRVPVRVGTLSKALGAQGGFVAGSRRLIDWLINRARPLIYSTALAPAVAAAARRALAIAIAEPCRRDHARRLSQSLTQLLREAGFAVAATTGPIVPVILGDPEATVSFAAMLRERGFLVSAIRPPSVPAGTSRLRISMTAAHTEEDVLGLAKAMVEIQSRPV